MVVWLTVKTCAKKTWVLVKKYWQIFLGASIPLVIWLMTRDSSQLDEVLQATKESHKKEIDAINESHKKELQSRDKAIEKYQKTIQEIEERYKSDKKVLSEKKKKEIKKILEVTEGDPEEMTKKLSELTGIPM